jgi:hypothetical protein
VPSAAHAQFLGYVANQTVDQNVWTNADCSATLTSGSLQNIGQVGHALSYTITSGGPNVQPSIQGSADNVTYFQISNNAPVQPGIIAATGSYPFLRAAVTGGGAGCRITANYYGSSVATTVNLTGANAQFMYLFNPFVNAAAGVTDNSANLSPPYGNSAGYFVFSYLGGAGPAGSTLALKAIDGPTGTTNTIATFNLATTSTTAQVFPIQGYAGNTLFLTYTAGGASASTFTLSYYFTYPGQGPSAAGAPVNVNVVSPNPLPVSFAPSSTDPCQSSGVAKISAPVNVADAAATSQLIAGVAMKQIFMCSASISVALGTADTVLFEYGTGSSCTSPTSLTGVYETFNTMSIVPIIQVGGGSSLWTIPAGASVCAVLAGGGAQWGVRGFFSYVQQ